MFSRMEKLFGPNDDGTGFILDKNVASALSFPLE